jgi:hypothetical protein
MSVTILLFPDANDTSRRGYAPTFSSLELAVLELAVLEDYFGFAVLLFERRSR